MQSVGQRDEMPCLLIDVCFDLATVSEGAFGQVSMPCLQGGARRPASLVVLAFGVRRILHRRPSSSLASRTAVRMAACNGSRDWGWHGVLHPFRQVS